MHKLILDACKKAGIKDVSKGYPAEAKERNAGTLRKFLYELDILMQEQDDERFKEVRRVQDLFNDASKKLNNLSEDLRKGERKHAQIAALAAIADLRLAGVDVPQAQEERLLTALAG